MPHTSLTLEVAAIYLDEDGTPMLEGHNLRESQDVPAWPPESNDSALRRVQPASLPAGNPTCPMREKAGSVDLSARSAALGGCLSPQGPTADRDGSYPLPAANGNPRAGNFAGAAVAAGASAPSASQGHVAPVLGAEAFPNIAAWVSAGQPDVHPVRRPW